MGILQTLILRLLLGELVLSIQSQYLAATILIVDLSLLMIMCMMHQHQLNGACMT